MFFVTSIFVLLQYCVAAQTNPLLINPGIRLPKDSVESRLLITALNGFLTAARKPNEENQYVSGTEKAETYILLDEMSGIENNGQLKDEYFYKPYLTNVVSQKDNRYLLQVVYIGTISDTAYLRSNYQIVAQKKNNAFTFSSPLVSNTKYWKMEKAGNNIFHYQNSINRNMVEEFNKLASSFDAKLKVTNKITELYCCEDLMQLQQLIGVDYKSDYNGSSESVWSSYADNKQVIVLGNQNADFNHFDPHDLWHDRLSLVISRSQVNKPVDEGCAYIYGGSWGLPWKVIFNEFRTQVAKDKSIDWSVVKEKPVYFKTNGFSNSADYIVNAILVQKIEREKGFSGVWEFLNCGKFEKGNERYYKTLERLTGISKSDYNVKVWELINSEK